MVAGRALTIRVHFVDQGYAAWVPLGSLRALPTLSRYVPITAVHCRMADVVRDDLYQHKLFEFRRILRSLRHMVRVQVRIHACVCARMKCAMIAGG